jgi:hypothetical protein
MSACWPTWQWGSHCSCQRGSFACRWKIWLCSWEWYCICLLHSFMIMVRQGDPKRTAGSKLWTICAGIAVLLSYQETWDHAVVLYYWSQSHKKWTFVVRWPGISWYTVWPRFSSPPPH